MNESKLEGIAAYAESHDFADEMQNGTWHDAEERDPDPMISTSLRLPKSLLDWVRAEAEESHVKHTALIRKWIEEKRSGSSDIASRVARLEEAVFRRTA